MIKMNKLKGSTFYLAGPMQYEENIGTAWRIKATEALHSIGIGVINPVDKPTEIALEDENTQNWLEALCEQGRYEEEFNPSGIEAVALKIKQHMQPVVGIDLRFVDKSDALLCNINTKVHTAGTYVECAHALLQRKPIIFFNSSSIFDMPRWFFGHADWRLFFNSLDKAIKYIYGIDNGTIDANLKQWKFLNYSKIYGAENVGK